MSVWFILQKTVRKLTAKVNASEKAIRELKQSLPVAVQPGPQQWIQPAPLAPGTLPSPVARPPLAPLPSVPPATLPVGYSPTKEAGNLLETVSDVSTCGHVLV